MSSKPYICDMASDDGLSAALQERSIAVANELAERANARIRQALSGTEIKRIAANAGVFADFVDRQILHERRLHSPFRSLERAVDLAEAVRGQLELARRLPSREEQRLVELVRRHALSVREIALALDRPASEIVHQLHRIWRVIRELS